MIFLQIFELILQIDKRNKNDDLVRQRPLTQPPTDLIFQGGLVTFGSFLNAAR